jgi:coenzyme PQQ precursor peptide PqqA
MRTIKRTLHNTIIRNQRTTFKGNTMWTTPSAQEMRFGFEVTMYVMNK